HAVTFFHRARPSSALIILSEMKTTATNPWPSILVCVACMLAFGSADAKDKAKGVRPETHTGWNDSLVLSAPRAKVKAVVVPAIGGRIAHYSLGGENIIYENPAGFGKTLANTKTNFSVGGYQCDIGPEIQG